MIGQTISHYEILEKLGEGGMGVVYKARDLKLERLVALKFLPARLIASEELVARFEQEARAVSALNHPNIATIHEIDQVDGERFLVLEYLPGGTLKTRLRQLQATGEKLSLEQIVHYALQIAEGLAHAHRRGIVHRDIKSENVMLTEEGTLKITDFGLAKLAGGDGLTQTGHTLGTAAYMSPEQARGEAIDHRSDIFSFGIVLYELAAGELPFKGSSGVAVLYEIVNTPAPSVAQSRRDLPESFSGIIGKTLAKNRDARYQRMEDLVADLKSLPTAKQRLSASGVAQTASSPSHAAKALPPAVAVLAFSNLSADPENEYFSDGLTEDLISALTQLEGLRVVARTSAFQFKGKAHDIREIGRQLNVGAVVEGSVRRAGDKVRVTAQLVNVADGFHLWSERYDREMRDVFAIQDEISRAIVKALKVKLMVDQDRPLVKGGTDNLNAYHMLLKGRYHWNKWTEEGFRKGMEYYSRAIAEDPAYAPAYAGLADCFNLLGFWSLAAPRKVMPQAKALAAKALEIDETLAEAHTSLGMIGALYDWDWPSARQAFQRAIELNPGDAKARLGYAMTYLAPLGHTEEAIAQMQRAQQLDPLSLVINTYLGGAYFFARQPDRAIEQYRKTLELDPNFAEAFRSLGWSYRQKSMLAAAVRAFEKARSLAGDAPFFLADLAYCYGVAGRTAEARQLLDQLLALSQRTYLSPYCIALVYIGLGDTDHAFKWLQKASQERSAWLIWLKTGPAFDTVRSDPRAAALMKEVGLDQD